MTTHNAHCAQAPCLHPRIKAERRMKAPFVEHAERSGHMPSANPRWHAHKLWECMSMHFLKKGKQLSIALLVFNTSWKSSYSRSPHIASTCPNIIHLLTLKSLGAGIQPPLWHRNKTPWQCRRLQQCSQEIAMQMWGFPHHKRFRKRPHHPRNVPPKML